MALTTPIVSSVAAFDATQSHTFSFFSVGGDQINGNTLTIVDSRNNNIIYRNTIESFAKEHTIPANTLQNGKYYLYYFTTYNDITGQTSLESNKIGFYCYTTPVVSITNFPTDSVIRNAVYEFDISYFQNEGELLNSLTVELYDGLNQLIETSDNLSQILKYTYSGFTDNTDYSIKIIAVTIENTIVETNLQSFRVIYDGLTLHADLEVNSLCDLGYNQITSNLIAIDGKTDGSVTYVEDSLFDQIMTVLPQVGSDIEKPYCATQILWGEGFSIPRSFSFAIWFYVRNLGLIANILKDVNPSLLNGYSLRLKRGIPKGTDTVKDYVELLGAINGMVTVRQFSNFVDPLNEGSLAMLWVQKDVNDEYTVTLRTLQQTTTANTKLEWGTQNISYGTISNTKYEDHVDSIVDTSIAFARNMDSLFPMNTVKICNGKYDNIYMSKNGTEEIFDGYVDGHYALPDWNIDTVMMCSFNYTINAGLVDFNVSEIESIKIKRRKKGTNTWLTIYKQDVHTADDLNVAIKDSIVPKGITQEYAIVPVKIGGIEGEYIVVETTPWWNGVFITINDNVYKLYNGVSYGSLKKNKQVGEFVPLSQPYPIEVQNGACKYDSGSVSGGLYGYNYEATRRIDRADVIKQTQDILDDLHSNSAIGITDWNGNVWLARTNTTPSVTFVQSSGNGICNLSFDFVEQGKYDNQEDLYENGLVDTLF